MLSSLSNSSMLTTGGRSSSCPGPVGCGWWWWSRARRPDDGNCWVAWEPTDCSSLPSVPWRETNTERLGSKVNKVRCYVFNGVSGIDSYPGGLERVSLNGALGLDCPWGLLADKTNDSSSSLLTFLICRVEAGGVWNSVRAQLHKWISIPGAAHLYKNAAKTSEKANMTEVPALPLTATLGWLQKWVSQRIIMLKE